MLPPLKETWMFLGQKQQRMFPWLICMLSDESSSVSCCWRQGQTSAAESILVPTRVSCPRRRSWQQSGMEKLCVAASCAGDDPRTMEDLWTRLWRLMARVQHRGRLRRESREVRLWLCGSAGQAHAPRAGKNAHALMSTETRQLACKSFGLGPSVPRSDKTCCRRPSARLDETLRQDKHPEQGAHTFPGITACLHRQSRENNYLSKEHCVITMSIMSS